MSPNRANIQIQIAPLWHNRFQSGHNEEAHPNPQAIVCYRKRTRTNREALNKLEGPAGKGCGRCAKGKGSDF